MHSRMTCIARLMAEVANLRSLADHLAREPFDFTAIKPLEEAAEAIRACAKALRMRRLWELSGQLLAISSADFSTPEGSAQLKSVVYRIESAAVSLDRQNSGTAAPRADSGADPLAVLDGTRWVSL
jgi:hypothetical protein